MSDNIRLHPERGIDPHKCYCPFCGEDNNELAIGHMRAHCTSSGEIKNVYPADRKSVATMDVGDYHRDLKEGERIPGGICGECEANIKEQREAIEGGGIQILCTACNMEAVIRKSTLADHVRKQLGVEPPEPCGIKFNDCKDHEELGIKKP